MERLRLGVSATVLQSFDLFSTRMQVRLPPLPHPWLSCPTQTCYAHQLFVEMLTGSYITKDMPKLVLPLDQINWHISGCNNLSIIET
jgi:hypothetical protein